MRCKRAVMLAVVMCAGQTLPAPLKQQDMPPVQTLLPANWAPGLEQEVAGIKPLMMNLWNAEAPNQVKGAKPERDDGTGRIWDVNVPGMLVYLPAKERLQASGGACIIECMGGSYTHLTRLVGADNTVGPLTGQGIAVVSLKYRLKPPSADPERDAVLDGKRALKLVRAHAAEWSIDPQKIGMLGWSAGANMVLSLATHPDADAASRPNFVVMWSPWPNGKTIDAYPVPKDAPPALLGTAHDDRTAPLAFAKQIQEGWEKAGDSVMWVDVATGGHGAFELGEGSAGNWVDLRLLPWLSKNGWWKGPVR